MADPDRLRNMLCGLLGSAEDWVPAVDRSFVSQGRPVPECEALGVWLENILAPASPGGGKAACQFIPRALFHVTLWQCVPSTSNDSLLEGSALGLADEAWAIWTGILAGFRDGTLFGDEPVACSSIDLGRGIVALPNGGGFGGWEASIAVDL